MTREIDDRKKRKALARIRRARDAAARAIARSDDPEAAEAAQRDLSDWEEEFVTSVEQRLHTYGSAFADPQKGDLAEPLSRLQEAKLKEIEKKAKGKGGRKSGSSFKPKGSGFKRKGAPQRAAARDINEDLPETSPQPARPEPPRLVRAADLAASSSEEGRARQQPVLRVIDGGKG